MFIRKCMQKQDVAAELDGIKVSENNGVESKQKFETNIFV